MKCPFCADPNTQVIDTRENEDGDTVRRRRRCLACDKRFTTYERVELKMPSVVKKNASRVDYDREKLMASMQLALRKRPVTIESIDAAIETYLNLPEFHETNYAISPSVSFKWTLHEGAALNKDIVSLFFSDDEDFYINLFRPVTRSLSPAEKNIKMHLLIVADTIDATIGKAVSIDIKRVTELFTCISSYLGIKLNINILAGKNYGKAFTQSALTKLRPAPTDIVIFYYSGHGFRIPEKPRAFPNMTLKNVKTPRTAFRDSLVWGKASRTANISQSEYCGYFSNHYKERCKDEQST